MKIFLPSIIFFLGATTVISAQVLESRVIVSEDNIENAYPRLSRDSKRILFQSNRTSKWQLFICDIDGKNQRNISRDTFNNNFPDFSPDNQWIAFVSDRDGNEEVYLMKADQTSLKRITTDPGRDLHPYFSPDGKYLLFNSDRNNGQFDVYRYEIGTGKTDRLTNEALSETCARYSPDMKSIVLLRNDENQDDVYLLHMNDLSMENISKTSNVEHGWPMFSSNGEWIYYSSMEKGTYSIYKIRNNGQDKRQITTAKPGEDHARVNISLDEKLMIYNVKKGKTISVMAAKLN